MRPRSLSPLGGEDADRAGRDADGDGAAGADGEGGAVAAGGEVLEDGAGREGGGHAGAAVADRGAGLAGDVAGVEHDQHLATGVKDATFGGGANGGGLSIDPSGLDKSDNGRIMIALPGGGFAFGGSCGPGNMAIQDACWVIIHGDGTLDTRFGTGKGQLAFTPAADGNDAFWGAAVSGNKLFLVGYRGGGALAAQTAANNDDSFVTVFDLP